MEQHDNEKPVEVSKMKPVNLSVSKTVLTAIPTGCRKATSNNKKQ